MERRIWSFRRRLLGNLLPLLVALPFLVCGVVWMYLHAQLVGFGLVLFCAGLLAGGVSVNWLGLFENAAMRREFEARNADKLFGLGSERYFVGFARPGYSNLLDPHEDVGFLAITPEAVEFVGESIHVRLDRGLFKLVRFRFNPHSLLGLGRWISVEGIEQAKPFRLLIEPREAKTLFANRLLGAKLLARLKTWIATGEKKIPDPR